MYSRILLCLDFSAQSDRALRFVHHLAEPAAEVMLLHVLTIDLLPRLAQLFDRGHLESEARSKLGSRRDQLEAAHEFIVKTQVRTGRAADELMQEIDRWRPDLIMLGSHGRRGLPRLLLGSVAERLLRRARVSTCIVKGEVSRLERVGLATDLREQAACHRFCELLRHGRHVGTVIHVFDDESWLNWSDWDTTGELALEVTTRSNSVCTERRAELDSMVARMRSEGHRVDLAMTQGRPWEQIVRLAAEENLQLLVIGSVPPVDSERSAMGSVGAKVARAAGCSVLVVPRSE